MYGQRGRRGGGGGGGGHFHRGQPHFNDPSTSSANGTNPHDTRGPGARIYDKQGRQEFEDFVRIRIEDFLMDPHATELPLEPRVPMQRGLIHKVARNYNIVLKKSGHEDRRSIIFLKPTAPSTSLYFAQTNVAEGAMMVEIEEKLFDELKAVAEKRRLTDAEVRDLVQMEDFFYTGRKPGRTSSSNKSVVPPTPREHSALFAQRQRLPIFQQRDKILDEIRRHRVTIVTGGTGSGKTTQVPQFLLEEAAAENRAVRVICTQPRRLPAISVAERVAQERGETLGSTVGYQIRLEQKCSAQTALVYCTSGMLLRMIMDDGAMHNTTHVILDEIHERETNTDYLLIALKQALERRDNLKVILMSATMGDNIQLFQSYFRSEAVGRVDVPGRLFPVTTYHLGQVLALTGHRPAMDKNFGIQDDWPATTTCLPPQTQHPLEHRQIMSVANQLAMAMTQQSQHRPTTSTATTDVLPENPESSLGSRDIWGTPPSTTNGFAQEQNFVYPPQQQYPSQQYQQYQNPVEAPGIDIRSNFSNAWRDLDQRLTEISHYPGAARFFSPSDAGKLLQNVESKMSLEQLTGSYNQALDVRYQSSDQAEDGTALEPATVEPTLVARVVEFCLGSPVDGAILVFLPGYDDICQVRDRIEENRGTRPKGCPTPMVLALHSQLSSNDQRRVFERAQSGFRKVILSTNIAEASLTIDDVVFVIDSGLAKEKRYEYSTRISHLVVAHVARSNAEQRAGRAGRCQPGFCFRLFSSETYQQMAETQTAEMLRSSIHEVCLHAKLFAPENHTVRSFLAMAPEPPNAEHIDKSLAYLEKLGALQKRHPPVESGLPANEGRHASVDSKNREDDMEEDDERGYDRFPRMTIFEEKGRNERLPLPPPQPPPSEEEEPCLTHLGRLIANLPLDPFLSRLLLHGVLLKCLDPVVTLVAALAYRDPFVIPTPDAKKAAQTARETLHRFGLSDHLTLLRAYYEVFIVTPSRAELQRDVCQRLFLSYAAMQMIEGIKIQLLEELRRVRVVPSGYDANDNRLNIYSHSWPMVLAAITAGCYPNVAYAKNSNVRRCAAAENPDIRLIHFPTSCIRRSLGTLKETTSRPPQIEFVVYNELAKIDEGTAMRTITVVPPLAVAIFGGAFRMSEAKVEEARSLVERATDVATTTDEEVEDDEDMMEEEQDEVDEQEELLRPRSLAPDRPQVRVLYVDETLLLRAWPDTVGLVQWLRFRMALQLRRLVANGKRAPRKDELLEDDEVLDLLSKTLEADMERIHLPIPHDWETMFPKVQEENESQKRQKPSGSKRGFDQSRNGHSSNNNNSGNGGSHHHHHHQQSWRQNDHHRHHQTPNREQDHHPRADQPVERVLGDRLSGSRFGRGSQMSTLFSNPPNRGNQSWDPPPQVIPRPAPLPTIQSRTNHNHHQQQQQHHHRQQQHHPQLQSHHRQHHSNRQQQHRESRQEGEGPASSVAAEFRPMPHRAETFSSSSSTAAQRDEGKWKLDGATDEWN